jgi:soluble lytic murein transglycosylase-like protein
MWVKGLIVPFVLLGMLMPSAAQRQEPELDPVEKAIERIERATAIRALAAEQVIAASQLLNEATALKKAGDHKKSRERVQEAERIAASIQQQGKTFLIEELSRLVAEHHTPIADPIEQNRPVSTMSNNLQLRSAVAKTNLYRDSLGRILQEEKLPSWLLAVAYVESRYNRFALSPKGARGIWQLMPQTAMRYGLVVKADDDHRTHPEYSTRAAARYLRDLYRMFGDWKLALAAYNWGEGNVQKVIRRTGIRDFDELARRNLIPAETRKYVPAILSLVRDGARSAD